MLRRTFIVHRMADGKSAAQIADEIAQTDRNWQIDLVPAKGELMQSLKPGALRVSNCRHDLVESQGEPVDPGCVEAWKKQIRVLEDGGITLTQYEIDFGL